MKKKICFLTDSIFSIGGVQRVTAVIAKELAKEYDVTIVTFDNPNDVDYNLYELNEAPIHYQFIKFPDVEKVKGFLFKVHRAIYIFLKSKTKWHSKIYAITSFPSEQRNTILNAIKKDSYDVIIGVHAPLAERLATLKKQFQNTLVIGWLHNSYQALFGEENSYFGAKRKRHYVYQFIKLDSVIVLCKNDAQQFHEYDNLFLPTIIYNPLTLKPDMPSSGNSKKFLTIGRFTPLHKGIDILIEAFSIFANQNKDWHLDIVGEGVEGTKYKTMIQQYQLEDRITIHPFTNQIQHYYSQAQVYVLSSRWEGMPLVLVEAMSHGLPIVASDLPVCEEILGDFGMFFKNKNIKDLAQRLEDATHLDWQAKSQEALKIAQRFDISHIIEQWKRLLES
jgi:glycosyltransferase involved in cell wall biosynthesis